MPVLQGEGIGAGEVISRPLPDLMAEYSEQIISLYGVTGTPEELLRMCPVNHGNMTREAKNMFLVMAMNESEVAIKEEHLPYFREVAESRGVELKVVVQEAPPILPVTPSPVQAPHTHNEKQPANIAATVTAREEPLHGTTIVEAVAAPQPQAVEPIKNRQSDADAGHELEADESTTGQMDEWLKQLNIEYEIRSHDLSVKPIFEQSVNPEDIPVNVPPQAAVFRAADKVAPGKLPILQIEQIVLNPPTPVENAYDATTRIDMFPVSLEGEEELALMETAEEEPGQSWLADDLEIGDIYKQIQSTKTTEPEPLGDYEMLQTWLMGEAEEPESKIMDGNTRAEYQQGKESLTLADLLPDIQEELPETPSECLMDQIASYIQHEDEVQESETGKEMEKEKAAVLMTEINSLTDELVLLNRTAGFMATEDMEKIDERLHELCGELLEILGVGSNDELLQKFILTIVKEKSSGFKGMEIGEAVYDVLHERKIFTLVGLAVRLQAKLPNTQLLGRYALAT